MTPLPLWHFSKNLSDLVAGPIPNYHNNGTQAGASLIPFVVVLTAAHKVAEFE